MKKEKETSAELAAPKKDGFFRKVKRFFIFLLVVILILGGFFLWHYFQMKSLRKELEEQQTLLSDVINSTAPKEDPLPQAVTENVVTIDVEAIRENIRGISELSSIEYRYTNAGHVDGAKEFKFLNMKVPFTTKSVVVTMDGVIKAGIDVSRVDVSCDEEQKVITVTLPAAVILSNELDEDSLQIFLEKDSIFNDITLDDNSNLRTEIKATAQQNAVKNGILDQATAHAKEIIRYLIEAVPGVKGTYTIEFK